MGPTYTLDVIWAFDEMDHVREVVKTHKTDHGDVKVKLRFTAAEFANINRVIDADAFEFATMRLTVTSTSVRALIEWLMYECDEYSALEELTSALRDGRLNCN